MGKLFIGGHLVVETTPWQDPQIVALELALNAIIGKGESVRLEFVESETHVATFIISPGILVHTIRSVDTEDMNLDKIREQTESMLEDHEQSAMITLKFAPSRPIAQS